MRGLVRFLAGVAATLFVAPTAVWWTLSVHEPYCAWGEAFWDGDLPLGDGPVRGLFLGSSRAGADVDMAVLAAETGFAWQRLARHTLTDNALPPSYPELLTLSDAHPGLDVLMIEVGPLLFDQTSCRRPPIPHVAMQPWWFDAAGDLGVENRPSALAMTVLPHRWLAGSGRRHDLVEHLKDPAHLVTTIGDLRHGTRGRITRWPGEPAPDLTPDNARNRREFLLGGKLSTWVPAVHEGCVARLGEVVEAAHAKRTVLLMLPMRPMLRATIEPEYQTAAIEAFVQLAAAHPGTVFLDYSLRYDDDQAKFNDFDHLNAEGAAEFTPALAAGLSGEPAAAPLPG